VKTIWDRGVETVAPGLYAETTISDETVALVREAMGDATRAVTMASG
jgi:hypothetical protein